MLTDLLSDPLDEGMNQFAYHTALEMARRPGFRALTNAEKPVGEAWISKVPFGKTLQSRSLKRALSGPSLRHCVYVPRSSLTMATMLRAWLLHRLLPLTQLHVLGLQRRPAISAACWMARKSMARFYVPSLFMKQQLAAAGLPVTLLPPGVNTERFRPATPLEKKRLRAEWGVPENRFVVTHIGPLRRSRNPAWFRVLSQQPEIHMVLIGSESQTADSEVPAHLRSPNVTTIMRYVPNIEDVYRLADLYFFPVLSPTGAIEWPLTVLEALACGLPVITTRLGGLNDVAGECRALVFVDREFDIPRALQQAQADATYAREARAWAEKRTWTQMLSPLLEATRT